MMERVSRSEASSQGLFFLRAWFRLEAHLLHLRPTLLQRRRHERLDDRNRLLPLGVVNDSFLLENQTQVYQPGLNKQAEKREKQPSDQSTEQDIQEGLRGISSAIVVVEERQNEGDVGDEQRCPFVGVQCVKLLSEGTGTDVEIERRRQNAHGENGLEIESEVVAEHSDDGEQRLATHDDQLPVSEVVRVGSVQKGGDLHEDGRRSAIGAATVAQIVVQEGGESDREGHDHRPAQCEGENGVGASVAAQRCVLRPVAMHGVDVHVDGIVHSNAVEGVGGGLRDPDVGEVGDGDDAQQPSLLEVVPALGGSARHAQPEDAVEENGDDGNGEADDGSNDRPCDDCVRRRETLGRERRPSRHHAADRV